MLEISLIKGEVLINLRIPIQKGFDVRILGNDQAELTLVATQVSSDNVATKEQGTTVTTSEPGDFIIDENGQLRNDKDAINNQKLQWLVADFHQERMINELTFTVSANPSSEVLFFLRIWGGTIFFPSSPQVQGKVQSTGEVPRDITIRFAEQKSEKALLEFGSVTAEGVFSLAEKNDSFVLNSLQVKAFSFPANLSLRIGDQSPFFEQPGELAPGIEQLIPDFSDAINTFLDSGDPDEKDGHFLVPLTMSSTADGAISLNLPQNRKGNLTEIDVTELGFSLQGIVTKFFASKEAIESVEELTLTFDGTNRHQVFLPVLKSATITEASLHLTGRLSEDRLFFSNVNDTSHRFGALGSGEFILAQRLDTTNNTNLAAVDLELEFVTETVQLSIAIHPDFNGQPSNSPLPETLVTLEFPGAGEIEKRALVKFELPSTVELRGGSYWIVLSVANGEVTWRINDEQPNLGGFLFSRSDGPVNWVERRAQGPGELISGSFRLHFLPQSTTDLINLNIGETEGAVLAVEDLEAIDLSVDNLNVQGQKVSLAEIIQGALFNDHIPIGFSTRANGNLTIKDLLVKFNKR